MANQHQLDLLRQGVPAWNEWKAKQPPDFRADLSAVNLRAADLSKADLTYASLTHADLSGARLKEADLRAADLSKADLKEADLRAADLSKADLTYASLTYADLSRARLREANLYGAGFYGADLREADLSRADLSNAHLVRADLSDAHLVRADLSNAHLEAANLREANLREANLRGADLISANLRGTDLTYADLRAADLRAADLSEAIVGWTIFGMLDLRTVKGLETLDHQAPSTIGTDTIERSQGDLPETFLRRAGLSETFITYARSLAQHPIEYYTCFISYSSKDEPFAKRLYADLQNKGVRCWFAPEDMKIGEKIRHRIDESIRLYDKLLLVLSEHSVASEWVEHEVEMALAKEHKEKRTVLFPIRLDEAIMHMEYDGWPAEVRHTRHIGNFTKWKSHDDFQQAFERLLRDLKAEKKMQEQEKNRG